MSLTVSVNEAPALKRDEVESVAPTAAESDTDDQPFTISLLLDASQKERESLDAIEKSMETLRLSLAQRRRVIDEQEEILRDLSKALMGRTEEDDTRR